MYVSLLRRTESHISHLHTSLGFTLVEIMIVIAIISTLSVALMPQVTAYIQRWRDSARIVQLQTIDTAMKAYHSDYETYPAHVWGCAPMSALTGKYIRPLQNPSGNTYNEWCGPNGTYAYWVSTGSSDVYLLMSQMENPSWGNYTGSTAGMIGDLTATGYARATNETSRWAWSVYVVTGWSPSSSYLSAYVWDEWWGWATINGSCGLADGTSRSTPPTTDLCSDGVESVVASTATGYFWSCQWSGWGTDDSCSAANIYAACTAAWETYTASTTYPGCNETDKIVCHWVWAWYTWAMCNVGSSTAGTTSASYGSMFQWWRNVAFPSTGTVTSTGGPFSLAVALSTSDFITWWGSWPVWETDWGNNLWWWATASTYVSASSGDQVLMQWPCASGYHVPLSSEATTSSTVIPWATFVNTLKVPLSGRRRGGTSLLSNQGTNGWWWMANQMTSSRSYYMIFTSTTANHQAGAKADGYNVRCLRNE